MLQLLHCIPSSPELCAIRHENATTVYNVIYKYNVSFDGQLAYITYLKVEPNFNHKKSWTKLPEDIAPVTLPNIVLTAPPALPTIPETPPPVNAPDAVFK